MDKKNSLLPLLAAMVLVGTLIACVRMPTEKQAIVDQRPSISFELKSDTLKSAPFYVDGQNFGSVGDFVEGNAAVRILSGTHNIRVMSGEVILLEEKFYIGDSIHRSFIVK